MSKRIAVLASGNGSNLQALIDSINEGYIDGRIVLVLSNNPKAYALERAKEAGIDNQVVLPQDFSDRSDYDKELIRLLKEYEVDLAVLAGYMLICSKQLVEEYRGRLINIHPSLLPSFAGVDGIGDAYDYGVKVTGVTVHFVDEGCDTGPIIMQEALVIEDDDTKDSLAKKIHEVEHRLLPKVVKKLLEAM